MRGIMMARSKTIKVIEPTVIEALTELVQYELPKAHAACKFIDADNPGQLIHLLQEEAKII
jgi:electron transfer flavoprotein beta subunit